MHIVCLTPSFPPFPGGGERYAGALMQEIGRRGHRVTVVTSTAEQERHFWQGSPPQAAVEETAVSNLTILRCPIRPLRGGWRGLLFWRKLMVLLSQMPGDQTAVLAHLAQRIPPIQSLAATLSQITHPIDLIHGFNISWEHPMLVGWQFAQQRKLPFVTTPFAHLGSGHDRVALNSTMDHQRRMLREAAAVLTLTDIERHGLARYGVDLSHIATIGGGLDPLPDPVPAGEVMARRGVKRPFLLFIGRHNQEKGAIHAAQAVSHLRQQGQPLQLLLIGQRTAEFDRFYSQLSPAQQTGIRPLGLLSEADKHALIDEAEMLLLPSRSDSFGIVLLEAWAHRKPVIGARSGGIPGVIDEHQNGLLVEFGDVDGLARAIAQLHHNPAQRQEFGNHGWHKTQTVYSWPVVADRVLAVYQQVAG